MRKRETEAWFFEIGADSEAFNEMSFYSRPALSPGPFWQPRMDLVEEQNQIVICLEIAGVRGEDLQLVHLPESNQIIVRGTRTECPPGSERRVSHHLEILYGDFERVVELPNISFDLSATNAQYKNGVLRITIPKTNV